MKVSLQVKEENGLSKVSLHLEFEEGEANILTGILNNTTYSSIIRKMKDINDLGNAIYNKLKNNGYYHDYQMFCEGNKEVIVKKDLVKEEYLQEIAIFIGDSFAKLLEDAIDIPEVDEPVIELTLPEHIEKYLIERGIDPTYRCNIRIKKDLGFNNLKLVTEGFVSQKINELANMLSGEYVKHYISIKLNNDDLLILPGNFCNLEVEDYSRINEVIKTTKEKVIREVNKIRDNNYFNLFASVAYHPLSFKNRVKLFEDPLPIYANVEISREWLLEKIMLEITLNNITFFLKKEARLEINLEGEGTKEDVVFHEKLLSLYATEWLTGDNITSSRFQRILEGDFSVIDEVEAEDKKIVISILKQIEEKLPKAVRSNIPRRKSFTKSETDNIIASVNVLDRVSKEKKDKIIAYLVAQRLKNS